MQCPRCSSRNVLCTDKGFFENSYVCQRCRHEFDSVGTGVKRVGGSIAAGVVTSILTGGLAIPAIVAAVLGSQISDE